MNIEQQLEQELQARGLTAPRITPDDIDALLQKSQVGFWQPEGTTLTICVEDGQTRYRRAGDRHRLARGHETIDPESRLLHLAHEAWNRLAELELMLRERPAQATSPAGRHTGAPDAAPEQAATEENRAAGKPTGDTSDQRWRVDFRRRSDGVPSFMLVLAGSAREAALRFNEMQGVLEEVHRAK